VRIHQHTRARDGHGAFSSHSQFTDRVRRKMEDPVSRRLVLPSTRFEQIAHDGDRAGTTHPFGRLRGLGETEHLMAARHEGLD
jgi:hypothetical protein